MSKKNLNLRFNDEPELDIFSIYRDCLKDNLFVNEPENENTEGDCSQKNNTTTNKLTTQQLININEEANNVEGNGNDISQKIDPKSLENIRSAIFRLSDENKKSIISHMNSFNYDKGANETVTPQNRSINKFFEELRQYFDVFVKENFHIITKQLLEKYMNSPNRKRKSDEPTKEVDKQQISPKTPKMVHQNMTTFLDQLDVTQHSSNQRIVNTFEKEVFKPREDVVHRANIVPQLNSNYATNAHYNFQTKSQAINAEVEAPVYHRSTQNQRDAPPHMPIDSSYVPPTMMHQNYNWIQSERRGIQNPGPIHFSTRNSAPYWNNQQAEYERMNILQNLPAATARSNTTRRRDMQHYC